MSWACRPVVIDAFCEGADASASACVRSRRREPALRRMEEFPSKSLAAMNEAAMSMIVAYTSATTRTVTQMDCEP